MRARKNALVALSVRVTFLSTMNTKGKTMSTISGVSSTGDAWANMKAQRSQMQAKMFAKVDADNSGGVDKTELQSLIDDVAKKTGVTNSSSTDALFSKMDANSDGSLSTDELGKGMKDIMPPPSTMDFAQSRSDTHGSSGQDDLFAKVDTDGNGSVSKDELQSLMDKMATDSTASTSSSDLFAKLDANGDGSLSATEFEAGRPQNAEGAPPPGGPPPAGGSGGASSTTYDPLDTNEDGTVSAKERLAGSSATDAVQNLLKAIDSNGDSKISSTESDAFITKLTSQIESMNQSAQNTGTDVSTDAKSTPDNIDLAELVKQAYEQIASGLTQQAKGATLSAVA
jgi:Ca2+-binding EF-hand superfamily protein